MHLVRRGHRADPRFPWMGDLSSSTIRLDQPGPLENRSNRAHRRPVLIRVLCHQPVQQFLRTPSRPFALGFDQPLRNPFVRCIWMTVRGMRAFDQSLPLCFFESCDRLVPGLSAYSVQRAQRRHRVPVLQIHLHKLSSLLHPVGFLPHLATPLHSGFESGVTHPPGFSVTDPPGSYPRATHS